MRTDSGDTATLYRHRSPSDPYLVVTGASAFALPVPSVVPVASPIAPSTLLATWCAHLPSPRPPPSARHLLYYHRTGVHLRPTRAVVPLPVTRPLLPRQRRATTTITPYPRLQQPCLPSTAEQILGVVRDDSRVKKLGEYRGEFAHQQQQPWPATIPSTRSS